MVEVEIAQEMLSFPGPACELEAWIAKPVQGGPFPAVVVIQEWWGLNDHIKDVASRFAREGYFAVAPDLYSRLGHKVTADPNEAAQLMMSLQKRDGVADLKSTVEWVGQRKEVNGQKVGVIGFCMGGSYALLLACASDKVNAVAAFYGEVPDDAELAKLSCPVLYFWGDQDPWIKRQDVERLAAVLKKRSVPGEVKIYEGRQHAFFNDTRKDVYDEAAAKDAWARVLDLFARHLRS